MSLTVTDLFAGAGGSSTGMVRVPGVEVKIAANHWQTACDVHNENHQTTDHAAVDLHQEDPRFFPTTDILWASPECTKWSQANGSKLPAIEEGLFEDPESDEAANRSRLLMFDVLRFIEHHRYRRVIVENVVDIAMQAKYRLAWQTWREQLTGLGYRFRVVSLNSMHAQYAGLPAPQSRDRLYIVCWPKGDVAPDIDKILRPKAWCPRCETVVESQQAFKPGRTVGRYRAQYVYLHGECGTVVEPAWLPAAAAIDWTISGERIGDRKTPLAEKTRAGIAAGIARYWRPFTLEAAGNTFERRPGVRTWPADEPLTTLHTTASKALAVPVEGRDGKEARPVEHVGRTQTTRPTDDVLRTLTTRDAYALLAPYYSGSEVARAAFEAMGTLTTRDRYALVQRHNTARGDQGQMLTPALEEMRTLTTSGHQSVVTPGELAAAESLVDDCLFRMLQPHEVAAGMAFPTDYAWQPYSLRKISNRDLVKLAGNAVTPPASRDLMHAVVESLGAVA